MPVAEKLDTLRVVLIARAQLVHGEARPGGEALPLGLRLEEPTAKVVWVAVCLDHHLACQDETIERVIDRFRNTVLSTWLINVEHRQEPFHSCQQEEPSPYLEQWEGGTALKRPVSLEPVPLEFRGRDDVPMRAIFRIAGG